MTLSAVSLSFVFIIILPILTVSASPIRRKILFLQLSECPQVP